MAHYKRIFAALDNGDTQLMVARRALSFARDSNAEVLFAHAIEKAGLEMGNVDIDSVVAKCKQASEEALESNLGSEIHDERIPSVKVEVRAGTITETLGEIAKEYKPDLVVCGVRGLSNIKYAFVGSVSTYLIRHMECDVLVVRPVAADAAE